MFALTSALDAVARAAAYMAIAAVVVYVVERALKAALARRMRRRSGPNLELERNLHDWWCNAGPWPHDGDCEPAPEHEATAHLILAQTAARGIGRLPGVEPLLGEDERCNGAGS